MNSPNLTTNVIEITVTPEEWDLLSAAAFLTGETVSEFALRVALEAARRLLKRKPKVHMLEPIDGLQDSYVLLCCPEVDDGSKRVATLDREKVTCRHCLKRM